MSYRVAGDPLKRPTLVRLFYVVGWPFRAALAGFILVFGGLMTPSDWAQTKRDARKIMEG